MVPFFLARCAASEYLEYFNVSGEEEGSKGPKDSLKNVNSGSGMGLFGS